jgi:hypothetical protein
MSEEKLTLEYCLSSGLIKKKDRSVDGYWGNYPFESSEAAGKRFKLSEIGYSLEMKKNKRNIL